MAAGAVRGRIGHLTSAAALRVTMQALIARTERKRTTYGMGISQMCELALAWLNAAGLFHTEESERKGCHPLRQIPFLPMSRSDWMKQNPKSRLVCPRGVVLRELGYDTTPNPTI